MTEYKTPFISQHVSSKTGRSFVFLVAAARRDKKIKSGCISFQSASSKIATAFP